MGNTPTFSERHPEQLRIEQSRDTDLDIILAWLKGRTIPFEKALFLVSLAAKFNWINKECVLIDTLLYCWDKQVTHLCLVLTSRMKELALKVNHDIPSAGHQGVARTKAQMKEKFV